MQKEPGLGSQHFLQAPRPAGPKLQAAAKEAACLGIKGWGTCFDVGKPHPLSSHSVQRGVWGGCPSPPRRSHLPCVLALWLRVWSTGIFRACVGNAGPDLLNAFSLPGEGWAG